MVWQVVSSDYSRHIVEAQRHLFKKYVPKAKLEYINLESEPVETWTTNVLKRLDVSQSMTVFGLDDFLPIDYFELPEWKEMPHGAKRIELGWGASRKGTAIDGAFNLFGDIPYRVSCQFSVWDTSALIKCLSVPASPWHFETRGQIDGKVLGLKEPFRYIEESSVSGRKPGKVNLCGLRLADIYDLVNLGLVDKEKIIYGWKGEKRTEAAYGNKYSKYF